MPARRIEIGPLLVLLGAVLLVIALFLDWYAPGLTAWDIFELLDLVLAALAIGAGIAAVSALGLIAGGPDSRTLPWLSGAALVLVLATVIDAPPAVGVAETRTGLWLALVAAVLMALGALLVAARVRISFDVEARRRRVSAVETRRSRDDDTPPVRRPWDEDDETGRPPRVDVDEAAGEDDPDRR